MVLALGRVVVVVHVVDQKPPEPTVTDAHA